MSDTMQDNQTPQGDAKAQADGGDMSRAIVTVLKLHFKKEPVALARPLAAIPDRFGTWVQVSQDQPLDKEMQDVLGTDKYIFREYLDERVFGPGVAESASRTASMGSSSRGKGTRIGRGLWAADARDVGRDTSFPVHARRVCMRHAARPRSLGKSARARHA